MRRFLGVAVMLSVVSSVQALAQTSAVGNRAKSAAIHGVNTDLAKKILALETKRIAAMVSKDVATLDTLLADDLSYTHSGGTTDTKDSFLTLIRERGRYLGVDYSNTQVIPSGGNTVVVRGRAQIRLVGTASYPVLFLDVWTLRDGIWKMVAWQATRIPESSSR
jgi:uncharacterized protein DUF4440